MAFFNKSKGENDKLSSEERAARREQRRAERNRKKKGEGSEESESKKSDKQVGANRSRKDESILRETVFETAVGIMKSNKLFRVSRDDEDLFVGILLKFDDIGGLSKRDMKDESKGQIITLINNGGIGSIFTNDLKSKDQIVFIPNADTLSQMSEFSLLADDLEYELVLVNAYDETIEPTDVFVDLDYLQKCHTNKQSISVKLAKVLEPTLLPGDDGYQVQPVQPTSPVQAAASTFSMDASDDITIPESGGESDFYSGGEPDLPDVGPGDEFEEYGGDFEPDEDEELSGDDDELDSDGDGDLDADDSAGESDAQPVYVGSENSAMALSRKFFNDDMARDLNTSALEQAIAGVGQFKPLLARPEDTWLSQQLNAMIDLANRELFALHQQNLDVVRNAYLNAIGSAYIDIMSKVQDYKSDSRYPEIEQSVKDSSEGIEEIVRTEREKLTSEWEEKVHNAGEVARINAEQTYRERYSYQFEERLRNIDAEVRAGLQAAENRAIADLKAARKREAQVQMDKLDSQEIASAVEAYQCLLSSETELYAKHEAAILEFLNENREAEIARVRILESELERDERIAQIQSEYREKAAALQADFEARITGLQSDIDTLRSRHSRDLSDKDEAYQALLAKYEADKAEWKGQIRDLTDEIVRANDSKEREVKIRVTEMQAERDSYSQKYDHLVATQKSANMMLIGLGVLGALAALFVGIVIGGKFNSHPVTPDSPPAISDTVLPSGDENNNSQTGQDGSQTGQDGQQGPSGDNNTQAPESPDRTPEPDPEWDAMQDPVI